MLYVELWMLMYPNSWETYQGPRVVHIWNSISLVPLAVRRGTLFYKAKARHRASSFACYVARYLMES